MEFRVLGPLEVADGDARLGVAGRKERALLVALALRAGQVVSVDSLVGLLWGEEPPRTVDKVLQTYISHVRRVVPEGMIVTRDSGYVLDVAPESVDAIRFENLLHRARAYQRTGESTSAAATFHDALSLWRSEEVAELGDTPAAQAAATRLTELRIAAIEERIEADLALGRHAELVDELRTLVGTHPFRERLWGHLVVALYRCGRQAEALRAAQRSRQILAEELGLDPSPALRRLEAAVLAHDPELQPPRGTGHELRTPGLEDTGFVGRERELGELTGAFECLPTGEGAFFLITGEPGIGKTRLAEEMSRQARAAGAIVAWGSAWEGRGAPAYWPWLQVLRSVESQTARETLSEAASARGRRLGEILADLGPGPSVRRDAAPDLDSDASRFALFDDVAGFLGDLARHRPVVVVLDDLHAADQPTLVLLQFIARKVREGSVLILGTAREVETRLDRAVAKALADTARFGRRLPLRGLSEAAVGALMKVTAAPALSDSLIAKIHGATGGNPFFLDELMRLLLSEGRLHAIGDPALHIPEGVRETVRRRLEPLSAEAREFLNMAAAVGRDFDLAVVERACRCSPATSLQLTEEARALDLVVQLDKKPRRHRFAHALVREALYDELEASQRAAMHIQVGEALESLIGSAPVSAAELAHHFVSGAPAAGPAKAVHYSVAAAEAAMARLAYEDAVAHYRRATDAMVGQEPTDRRRRGRLLVALSDAHRAAGQTVEAGRVALEAAEAARSVEGEGEYELLAEAALRAPIAGTRGEPAMSLLVQALESLPARPTKLGARLLVQRAQAEVHSMFDGRAVETSRQAVAVARQMGDPQVLLDSLSSVHLLVLRGLGSVQERQAVTEELERVAEQSGASELRFAAHFARIFDLLDAGDVAGFEHCRSEYALLAEELQIRPRLRSVTRWQVLRLLLAGRFEEAEPLAEAQLAEQERLGDALALVPMFHLRLEQGRLEELESTLRRLASEYPQYPWRPRLAGLLADHDRRAEAQAEFDGLAAHSFADLNATKAGFVLPLLAEVCAYLGDEPRAELLYRRLLPYEGRCVVVGGSIYACTGAYSRYLGLLAATVGRWDDAERHLHDALELHERMPSPPLVARTRHDMAAMLLARGDARDVERARALAMSALEAAEGMGMRGLASRSRALVETMPLVAEPPGGGGAGRLVLLPSGRATDSRLSR